MKAPDSSTLIAAFAEWHESHDEAVDAIAGARLIGHTMFEFVSVLSRLPEPHRVESRLLTAWLKSTFTQPPLVLTAKQTQAAVEILVASGVTGGAIYDGLIGLVARTHEATLISLDQRAMSTYQRLGVDLVVPKRTEGS